jgi:hypothetical protein
MRGGSEGLVARLIQALSREGARLLDATGTRVEDKKRFLKALKAESRRTHAESQFDVMIGIQRVLEGTDWPMCSAVYCVGMPGSLNTVVQLLGRAMRPKGDEYPAAQRDRARLIFFVPCAGGSALADLSMDHSRHALLTCCFLADHEVGQEWIVLREVRRGIEDALGPRADNPGAADAENAADEALDPEIRAEVELAIATAREEIISNGGEPTLGEVIQLAAKTRPDLPEAALHRVATEILASQSGSTGETAREAIHQEIAKRLRIDPMVKKAMEEAFAVVLNEFRDVTLIDSAALESVRRQVHGVTGGQMREFAQRLRDAIPRPLTEEQILAWADASHAQTGDWPQVKTGPVVDAPHETWSGINRALEFGMRGLPGKNSLARLLADHRGVRNSANLEALNIEQILAWADTHHERTGGWPGKDSGPIETTSGGSWACIDAALRKGTRGLPGGSSLAQLLAERRGVRNIQALPDLNEQQILLWADSYHSEKGTWPNANLGLIEAAAGETWANINQALVKGLRGLSGGSSLAKLLAKHRGVRNIQALPDFAPQLVLAWIDAHYERTGEFPTRESGSIPESLGETWAALDKALRNGRRGLTGTSSLAQLLAEHRGVRNLSNLPSFSIEQILTWADCHQERTGAWPTADAGQVIDAPGEKWSSIECALADGLRGLPGGSSLAKLLAEHRGVRNRKLLPALTLELILGWADTHYHRTDRWPTRSSGPVFGAPGETWANIDQALVKRLRQYPSSTSLAKLLAEHRGVRNIQDLPKLTEGRILIWAEAHRARTGNWPTNKSGPITGAPNETWANVAQALVKGLRGLQGGSSLARLVAKSPAYRTSDKQSVRC